MQIELTPQRLSSLENEAAIRNATLDKDATPHTAESIAQHLLESACDSYGHTHALDYARSLYERILTATPSTQKAIFTAAEKVLSP